MLVNNIGYTEFAFRQLGAKRPVPQWGPPPNPGSSEQTMSLPTIPEEIRNVARSADESRELKEAFGKYFMRIVSEEDSFQYKLTTAIGEMHLGSIANPDV